MSKKLKLYQLTKEYFNEIKDQWISDDFIDLDDKTHVIVTEELLEAIASPYLGIITEFEDGEHVFIPLCINPVLEDLETTNKYILKIQDEDGYHGTLFIDHMIPITLDPKYVNEIKLDDIEIDDVSDHQDHEFN